MNLTLTQCQVEEALINVLDYKPTIKPLITFQKQTFDAEKTLFIGRFFGLTVGSIYNDLVTFKPLEDTDDIVIFTRVDEKFIFEHFQGYQVPLKYDIPVKLPTVAFNFGVNFENCTDAPLYEQQNVFYADTNSPVSAFDEGRKWYADENRTTFPLEGSYLAENSEVITLDAFGTQFLPNCR